jgi:hypothetical protein
VDQRGNQRLHENGAGRKPHPIHHLRNPQQPRPRSTLFPLRAVRASGPARGDKRPRGWRKAQSLFENSRRKLRRVVHVNSAGTAVEHGNTEHIDRSAIQEFNYNETGELKQTVLRNAREKTIAVYAWGANNYDRVDIKQDVVESSDVTLAASFTSISDNLFDGAIGDIIMAKAEIRRFVLTRDEAGRVTSKAFMRYNGNDSIRARDAGGHR